MRAVSRGTKLPPVSLGKKNAGGKTELDRARAYMASAPPGGPVKAFSFAGYRSEDVKERLGQLFHSKCAYCESPYGYQSPVDVEHYRPKGNIEGNDTHPGYWWLAAEWTNLVPSCIDCNRRRKQKTPNISSSLTVLFSELMTGKKDAFPVLGKHVLPEFNMFTTEQPLLLDPTRDNPDEHLLYCFSDDEFAGLVFPAIVGAGGAATAPLVDQDAKLVARHAAANGMSVRGAISIQCYGLNRVGLVQQRARIVQQLRFLEGILVDVGLVRQDIETLNVNPERPELSRATRKLKDLEHRVLLQMRGYAKPAAPFSAIAQAYLNDFVRRLSGP